MSLSTSRVVHVAALLTAPLLAPLLGARAAAAATATPPARPRATVVVRVYELGGARTPELTDALSHGVTRLLERANTHVSVAFVDCSRPHACDTVARGALVLRLVPGMHAVVPKQCGEASKGVGRQRGVLMTVYRGCIDETRRELREGAIAEQGVTFALLALKDTDILAAVVVHELIHLILPDEAHGKGLFKATLDPRDWLDLAAGWSQLDTALVSRLDRALADRPVPQTMIAERLAETAPPAAQQQQP